MDSAQLKSVTLSLLDYCRRTGWAGWDPYDGLNSRLFQKLPFSRAKTCRLVLIQLMKRSPINLRRLLLVPPGRNPKGTALFASNLARLSRLGLAELNEARALVDSLVDLRCPDLAYASWGYHFDWQTRRVLVPRSVPNIVCTTFVAHAFLDVFDATGHPPYLEMARSSGRFITDVLAANLPDDFFCIRYYTVDRSSVHNASLLGAALLARLHGYAPDSRLIECVTKAVRFSLSRQRTDGSWPYGELGFQSWIDSFHTGYNLLALRTVGRYLEVPGLADAVNSGYEFYRKHFFPGDGAVAYFHDRVYPVDAHAVGHALATLADFADHDVTALPQALRCMEWAVRHLRSRSGCFHYQYRPWFTNRISYMRWSQAWMLTGLVALLERIPLHSNPSRAFAESHR